MTQQNKIPGQTDRKPGPPRTDDLAKQEQRQKSEQKEVAGRHKNDGQKGHKGAR